MDSESGSVRMTPSGRGREVRRRIAVLLCACVFALDAFQPCGGSRLWVAGRQRLAVERPRLTTATRGKKGCISLAATGTQQESEDGELSRRLILGAAIAAASVVGSKKFLVDGNMQELSLKPGSLKGKTIVITGGNTGLGLESANRLAKAGATIVITARSDAKGSAAVQEIKRDSGNGDIHYLTLDLADLSSVKAFKSKYEKQAYGQRIDVLVNNAGVMAIPLRMQTKDGFEMQIGTNHLGHFALVAELFPLLKKAVGGARVVNVSSTAHLPATAKDFEGDFMAPERYTQWGAYCTSKLANILFAKELDRRCKAAGLPITAVSCHPGAINTDLARWIVADGDAQAARDLVSGSPVLQAANEVLARPVNLGANTQVYLAAGLDGGYDRSGGMYFDNMAPGLLNPVANDEALAKQLWEDSERLTGFKLVVA